ncbi:acyl-CoA dehydrogenase family protein [Kutzneria sp. 744]|uniref:acyl-CoA dehydrogenase family protein n=1 Tax=Kutzneria sp. (strain 744) TaxID=345341 RepID=UPI0003EEDD66|nr:acyl-CoA dehydrogenase family protein [Kutzneria sp. 744]EWM18215.1 acyl-CoA dehydrogenase [Kutzneria sp. 744]
MTSFDELQGLAAELAAELRPHALAVDAGAVPDIPALDVIRDIATPPQYRDSDLPKCAELYTETCLARTAANIELSRGDAGVLNICRAPSLAGLAVDALGSPSQQEAFYRVLADDRPWTFFGMTEPACGSDATAMKTVLDKDFRLHGAKKYVANAARGGIGLVFARTGPTPLSIRAVVVRNPSPGYTGRALTMFGLRGAALGEMTFDGIEVGREALLGAHLPASRRGLWGIARTFNVMRLQIGAQALGVALAISDYVHALRPQWRTLMTTRLEAARELLLDCAHDVDNNPDDRRAPSIGKLHATNLAVETARWASSALEPGALLEHPLLEKWCRDVHAFEFMDGTSTIQRLTIGTGHDDN